MKKKIWIIILLVISFSLIIIGIALYEGFKDRTKGCFFRQVYGSVGLLDGGNISINYELFNFSNSSMNFLDDMDNLSFDNDSIKIDSISYSKKNSESNLDVYDVEILISIVKSQKVSIKKLIYNQIEEYPLGDLTLCIENYERISINHSVDTNFYDNRALIRLSNNKDYSFTVQKIIYDDKYIDKINYNLLTIDINKTGEISIELINTTSGFDLFYFLPIFEIELNDETKYFTPLSYTTNYEGMTYLEIREYVHDKNRKC